MMQLEKKFNSIFLFLSTLGPIGYSFAAGTKATFLTIPFILFLNFFEISLLQYFFLLFFLSILFIYLIKKSLRNFVKKDPSEIVIDEVLGFLVTFFGITINFYSIFYGFIIFRILDIFKPFGLKKFEKLPGAYGILSDDLFAGVFSNLLLRIFV